MQEFCSKCSSALDWIDPEINLGFCFNCGIPVLPNSQTAKMSGTGPTAGAINRMKEIASAAGAYYRAQLGEAENKKARAYLEKRCIAKESIARFNIGYAPEGPQSLLQHLCAIGYTEEEALAAGFVSFRDDGQLQDSIRDRLVFPLHNPIGDLVAFSGRLLAERRFAPKYLNTASSAIYRRNFILYNSHNAALSSMPYWILVEGYTDVVALYNYGFPNVVSSMGTALNDLQVKIIKGHVDEVVMLFDGDSPGVSAMYSASEKLEAAGLKISGHILPGKHDPDSYLKGKGAERLKYELDAARQTMSLPWSANAPISDSDYLRELCRRMHAQKA